MENIALRSIITNVCPASSALNPGWAAPSVLLRQVALASQQARTVTLVSPIKLEDAPA